MGRLFANPYYNFFITTGIMLLVSVMMYSVMLRKNKNNIAFLLLFGLILSNIVQSLTNYIEVLLHPQQFQQLKAVTAVSITNMNESIIVLAAPAMVLLTFLFVKRSREFDVMQLGESNAKSLRIPYTRRVNQTLVLISLAMAVTTALIGPVTFLGLLGVNIARELFQTYRHSILFFGSIMVSALCLVLGQGIVELLRSALDILDAAGMENTGIERLGIQKTQSCLPDYLSGYLDGDYVNWAVYLRQTTTLWICWTRN